MSYTAQNYYYYYVDKQVRENAGKGNLIVSWKNKNFIKCNWRSEDNEFKPWHHWTIFDPSFSLDHNGSQYFTLFLS